MKGETTMKPNKPNAQEKRSTLETLRTLWVPMAVGAVGRQDI